MTRDDLLQAIVDDPDDDACRLVFADWLEDHGERERAEFIRVQIELAKLPTTEKRRRILQEREAELLAGNEGEWVKPIRHCVDSWTFDRGFVAEVTVTVDMYMKHTFELVRQTPIRRMWVDGWGNGTEVRIGGSARELVPETIARECLVLPLGHARIPDDCLVVAMPWPIDTEVMQRLQFVLNRSIAVVEAARQPLEEAINRHYRKHG
jgi:uncharacterized protein (TIGR02996 family)